MIKKYKSNNKQAKTVIEAVKWSGNNVDEISTLIGSGTEGDLGVGSDDETYAINHNVIEGGLVLRLSAMSIPVAMGDYVTKNAAGAIGHCNPQVFEDGYKEVVEAKKVVEKKPVVEKDVVKKSAVKKSASKKPVAKKKK